METPQGMELSNFGRCERCGEAKRLDAHHMARNPKVHDPARMAGLCSGPDGCHMAVEDHRADDWEEWIEAPR